MHDGHRLLFSSGHKEAGTVYPKNATSSRTPGADSGTGTLAAFRLPRESVSQAGCPYPAGGGVREESQGLANSGPGRSETTPCRAPGKSGGVARHRAKVLSPTPPPHPRPREPTDTARGASLRGTKVGLPPRRRAQPGALPRGPSRCGGSGRGCEPRRPSPAALPGTC